MLARTRRAYWSGFTQLLAFTSSLLQVPEYAYGSCAYTGAACKHQVLLLVWAVFCEQKKKKAVPLPRMGQTEYLKNLKTYQDKK